MKRRKFFKTTFAGMAGTMTLSGAFAEIIAGTGVFDNVASHFSLNKIKKILDGYSIPFNKNPLNENLAFRYTLFTLGGRNVRPHGTLVLSKSNTEQNGAKFNVDFERKTTRDIGYSQFIKAEYYYRDTSFLLLDTAKKTVKIARDKNDKPVMYSSLDSDISVKEKKLIISENSKSYSKSYSADYLLEKWTVPFVIQSYGKDNNLSFDLLDETDQVLSEQKIGFYKAAKILFTTGSVETRSFLHTGRGTLPTVYWFTEDRIPFAFISGSEVYLLSSIV